MSSETLSSFRFDCPLARISFFNAYNYWSPQGKIPISAVEATANFRVIRTVIYPLSDSFFFLCLLRMESPRIYTLMHKIFKAWKDRAYLLYQLFITINNSKLGNNLFHYMKCYLRHIENKWVNLIIIINKKGKSRTSHRLWNFFKREESSEAF